MSGAWRRNTATVALLVVAIAVAVLGSAVMGDAVGALHGPHERAARTPRPEGSAVAIHRVGAPRARDGVWGGTPGALQPEPPAFTKESSVLIASAPRTHLSIAVLRHSVVLRGPPEPTDR